MEQEFVGTATDDYNKEQTGSDHTENQREMEKEIADLEEPDGDGDYENTSSDKKLKYEDEFQILQNAYDAY